MPKEAGYGSGYRSASRYDSKSAEANKSFFTSPVVQPENPFASNPDMGTGKVETIIEYKNSLWELEEGWSDFKKLCFGTSANDLFLRTFFQCYGTATSNSQSPISAEA